MVLEEINSKLICFKNIAADAICRLDKIDNLNNNKSEPTLESLSENFASNDEDVLHPTSFKIIIESVSN